MQCSNSQISSVPNSLAQLVANVVKRNGCSPRDEIKEFRNLKIGDAIKKAAQARLGKGIRPDGTRKLHSHQRWLKPKTANEAQRILLQPSSLKKIAACKNFDDLHNFIKSEIDIDYANEMYWYDTAFRIGISMGIYPKKVYLHAATRKGARALGLYQTGQEVLEMADLIKRYREFKNMRPYEVEDFLCVENKKGRLSKFNRY